MKDFFECVFISYRRSTSWSIARAIYNELEGKGFDVYMDVERLDNGRFGPEIIKQIDHRPNFLVILDSEAIERFNDSNDWFRFEIEHAIDTKRNIIPILTNNFNFSKEHAVYFTGKLEMLSQINAVKLDPEYFQAAMEKIINRCYKIGDEYQGLYDALWEFDQHYEEKRYCQKNLETIKQLVEQLVQLINEWYMYTDYKELPGIGVIVKMVKGCALPELRAYGIQTLLKFPHVNKEAVEILKKILTIAMTDPSKEVKEAASLGLAELNG